MQNWWSRRWLSSLLFGVGDRELMLGLRYAERGQVVQLNAADNRVLADLVGPNGGRHKNYLVFPKFDQSRSELFVEILKRQPAELLAISNNSLNQSIELILAKCELQLFDNFGAVKMECDCKDALPCKYTIATLAMLAHNMDSDPCLLFKLHGLSLDVLKNYKATTAMDLEVPEKKNLFKVRPHSENAVVQKLPEFNFLQWRDYSKILPTLLKPRPSFGGSLDFKKTFCSEMERINEFYKTFFSFSAFAEDFSIYNQKVAFDPQAPVHLEATFFLQNENGVRKNGSFAAMASFLCSLEESEMGEWHRHVQLFYNLLKFAYYLVRNGAIYPQVYWVAADTAQVRWLPADMLPEILSMMSSIEAALPEEIVLYEGQPIYERAEHILSGFIGALFHFARIMLPPKRNVHDNLLGFFFDCKTGTLKAAAHAIPAKIQEWFSVYNTLDFKTQIVFLCSEQGDDIAVNVFTVRGAERMPLADLFAMNDSQLLSVLNVLNCVAEWFAPLGDYIASRATQPLLLHGEDLLQFLNESIAKMKVLGIQVELPKSLLNIRRPEARISIGRAEGVGSFSAEDLLDFDWEVAVGDEQISAKEFLKLAETAEGLLKYKSQYIRITEEDLKKIKERAEAREQGISKSDLMRACFAGELDSVPITLTPELKAGIDAARAETDVDLPEGLNATLRPYQKRGYSWLYSVLKIGLGVILADDMGLGKTLQVIAFLLKLKIEGKLQEKKALVVVPAGLLCNWQMEVKKFAPDLGIFSYHGGARDLKRFKHDVLVTTYATCRRDFEKLKEIPWQIVVIDEAQNIKNAESEQSKILRSFAAPMKIAMSGTPVENRLMEFWTIMDFCNRGLLPPMQKFRDDFETPIQKNNDAHAAELLKKIAAPFMLRRLKTDKSIISDLPDKIIQDEYAELTKAQAMLYRKTLEQFMQQLNSADEDDAHALFKRKGIVLQMILAMKQICNHPQTFLKRGVYDAAQHTENLSENGNAETPVLHRSLSEDSGKLRMLMDLLESIQEQGEKTLIFTQFAEMGELLKDAITNELNLQCDFYHGGLSQTQRKKMVEDFQQNPENKVLILSLKAGGTGLNLTAASQVIHYDLWWNPAIEAQATDRAFRIGQTRNVQVHRFITKGTFEEKINALLERKRAIANMTVYAGETWLADLSDKELGEVFRLEQGV